MGTDYLAPAITVLGLIICFGSTYFRKICSAIIGFVWGTIISAIVLVVMALLGMMALADTDLLLIALLIGVLCAVVFYLFEKIAAIINSFILFAFLALLLGMFLMGDIFSSISALIIFMMVAGAIGAIIQIVFDRYAFAVITAFTGALIAGIGIISMAKSTDLSSAAYNVIYGDTDFFSSLPIYVIVLGSMGTVFQLYGLSVIKKKISEGDTVKVDYSLLTDLIKNNFLVIVAPCIATLLPHFIGWASNYGSEVKTYGDLIYFIEDITIAFMIGCAIYLLSKNKVKSAVVMLVLYDCLHILVNYYNYFVSEYRWSISPTTFKGIGTAVVLLLFSLALRNRYIKLTVLPFVGYISFEYLMNWIAGKEVYAVGINLSYFIMLIATYITVMALHYKDSKEIIYKNRLSAVVLVAVLLVTIGFWGYGKWKIAHGESEMKGGWQNYKEEQQEYKNDWNIIKNEDQYTKLIQGGITADQLREAFLFFDAPSNSDEIDDKFAENSYWLTFRVCDRPEEFRDESTDPYSVYVYELEDVNDTLSGLTNFQFEDNSGYGDNHYTEDGKLYIYMAPTDWGGDRLIKNLRGRYNNDEMIVDYDWYHYDYYSEDPEEEYLYSLSAVFIKNEEGKFKLDRIESVDGNSESGNNNTEYDYSDEEMMDIIAGTWEETGGGATMPIVLFRDGTADLRDYDGEYQGRGYYWYYENGVVTIGRDWGDEVLQYNMDDDTMIAGDGVYHRLDESLFE